jgi:hypothetical protein
MMIDDVDSCDIWQQILWLKILYTDSENSSVIGSSGTSGEIAAVLNLDDNDIATLAAAIDKFEIVNSRSTEDIKPKPKQGRPKKQVVVVQCHKYTIWSTAYTSSWSCQQVVGWYPWLCLTNALRPVPIPISMWMRLWSMQLSIWSLSISCITQM